MNSNNIKVWAGDEKDEKQFICKTRNIFQTL